MHRPIGRSAVLAFAVFAAACGRGDGAATSPSEAPTFQGAYVLQTVNAAPLPYVLIEVGDLKSEIVGDQVTFENNGTFKRVIRVRNSQNGVTTIDVQPGSGSYSVSGKSMTLRFNSDGSTATVALGNGTLSYYEPVFRGTWSYRRQ